MVRNPARVGQFSKVETSLGTGKMTKNLVCTKLLGLLELRLSECACEIFKTDLGILVTTIKIGLPGFSKKAKGTAMVSISQIMGQC
jgi:hypothetical protein